MDRCVTESVNEAIVTVTTNDRPGWRYFPVLPLVTAGDDLWIVCRRDLALSLATEIGNRFADKVKTGIVETARHLFSPSQDEPITLSLGLLFSKQGYPFDAQMDLVADLEHNAKKHRKDRAAGRSGCIDFHWLVSSARETIDDARISGLSYLEPDLSGGSEHEFRLYSRPWTLAEADAMIKAAEEMKEIARRKLKQLEQILRLGKELSGIAMQRWYTNLTAEEQETLEAADRKLPERLRLRLDRWIGTEGYPPTGPWHADGVNFYTTLWELVELEEILR